MLLLTESFGSELSLKGRLKMFFSARVFGTVPCKKALNMASMFFACIMWGFVIQGHISAELL